MSRVLTASVALSLLFCLGIVAQPTGTITGTVGDESGAVVPNAITPGCLRPWRIEFRICAALIYMLIEFSQHDVRDVPLADQTDEAARRLMNGWLSPRGGFPNANGWLSR
jgi:hypothetical protein